MWFLGKQDVEDLRERGDLPKLLRCLEHRDRAIRRDAAVALLKLSHRIEYEHAKILVGSLATADEEVACTLLQIVRACGSRKEWEGGGRYLPASFWPSSTLIDLLAARRIANTHLLLETVFAIGYEPAAVGLDRKPEAAENVRRLAEIDWTRYDLSTQALYFSEVQDLDRLAALGAGASDYVRRLLEKKPADVAAALGRLDPEGETGWAISLLLESLREWPRQAVLEALRLLRWQPNSPEDKTCEHVALREWGSLVEMGQSAVSTLSRLLLSPHLSTSSRLDQSLQDDLAATLAAIGDREAIPALITAYANRPHWQRDDIRHALTELGRNNLDDLLAHMRSYPTSSVALVLAEIGDPRAIDTLIEVFEREPTGMGSWDVVRALSAFEHPDPRRVVGVLIREWRRCAPGGRDNDGGFAEGRRREVVAPIREALETITGHSFGEYWSSSEVAKWEQWARDTLPGSVDP